MNLFTKLFFSCAVSLVVMYATTLPIRAVDLDDFTFERIDGSEFQRGGVFVSEFPEIEDAVSVPLPEVRKIYLFEDHFALLVSVDNVGDVHPMEVGIWRVKEGRILLFCGSPLTVDAPCESFELWKVRRDGIPGSILLSEAGVVKQKRSALEVFLASAAFAGLADETEARRLLNRLLAD